LEEEGCPKQGDGRIGEVELVTDLTEDGCGRVGGGIWDVREEIPGVKTSSMRIISPISVSPSSNFVSAMIIPLVSAYVAA
jgi:hypothetical protein